MRVFLAVLLLLSTAVLAACGNDDEPDVTLVPSPANGSDDNGQAPNEPDDAASGDDADAAPTRRAIPTATPVPDDGVTVLVTGGGELTMYTPVEIRALPETSISAGGETYTGVSLADLAASAGGSDATYVSIEGYSPDGQRLIGVRFPLADVGADSVLVINESGHLSLASESIDPAQWVGPVAAIDFV